MTYVAQRRENNHEVDSTQRLNLCCFLAFRKLSKIAINSLLRHFSYSHSLLVFTRDSIYAIARICYRPPVCLSVCQMGGSVENG